MASFSDIIAPGDAHAADKVRARMAPPVIGLMLVVGAGAEAAFQGAEAAASDYEGKRFALWLQDPAGGGAAVTGLPGAPADLAGVVAIAIDCVNRKVADVLTDADVPGGLEQVALDVAYRKAGA